MPRLLYSDFRPPVTLTAGTSTGNRDQYLRGGDWGASNGDPEYPSTTAPLWGVNADGHGYILTIVGPGTTPVSNYSAATLKNALDHTGATRTVLSLEHKLDSPNTGVEQIMFAQSGVTVEPVVYQKMWFWVDPGIEARMAALPTGDRWAMVWEMKAEPDYRMRVQMLYNASVGRCYWHTQGDVLTNADALWEADSNNVQWVRPGEWHRLEVFMDRNAPRFRVAIDGQQLIDKVTGSLRGATEPHVSLFMFCNNYGVKDTPPGGSMIPGEYRISELEIWDEIPPGAFTSGVTNTGRVLCLGDSLTQGAESDSAGFRSYRGALQQMLQEGGYTVDFVGTQLSAPAAGGSDANHDGYGGARMRSADSANSIETRLADIRNALGAVDIIILLIGWNDVYSGTANIDTKFTGLLPLIQTGVWSNAKVVLVTLSPEPGKTVSQTGVDYPAYASLNAAIRSSASASRVVADLAALTTTTSNTERDAMVEKLLYDVKHGPEVTTKANGAPLPAVKGGHQITSWRSIQDFNAQWRETPYRKGGNGNSDGNPDLAQSPSIIGHPRFVNTVHAIANWLWVFAGPGHASTNTVVEARNMFAQALRRSNNQWEFFYEGARVGFGSSNSASYEPHALSLSGARPDGITTYYRVAGGANIESWANDAPPGRGPISGFFGGSNRSLMTDAACFCAGVQVRLALLDPNGPNDIAQSRYVVVCGFDAFAGGKPRYDYWGWPHEMMDGGSDRRSILRSTDWTVVGVISIGRTTPAWQGVNDGEHYEDPGLQPPATQNYDVATPYNDIGYYSLTPDQIRANPPRLPQYWSGSGGAVSTTSAWATADYWVNPSTGTRDIHWSQQGADRAARVIYDAMLNAGWLSSFVPSTGGGGSGGGGTTPSVPQVFQPMLGLAERPNVFTTRDGTGKFNVEPKNWNESSDVGPVWQTLALQPATVNVPYATPLRASSSPPPSYTIVSGAPSWASIVLGSSRNRLRNPTFTGGIVGSLGFGDASLPTHMAIIDSSAKTFSPVADQIRAAYIDPTRHAADGLFTVGGALRLLSNARSSIAMQRAVNGHYDFCPHNLVPNSSGQGAVINSTTLPSTWSMTVGGVVATIIGRGTENGHDYIDVRFAGTATTSSNGFRFVSNAVPAPTTINQTTTSSIRYRIVGGSRAGLSTLRLNVQMVNSGGSILTSLSAPANLDTGDVESLDLALSWVTLTATDPTTASTRPQIIFGHSIGAAVDITLRISEPAIVYGRNVLNYVPTFGTAVYGPAIDYLAAEYGISRYALRSENQRTNSLRNSSMLGNANALPTNWVTMQSISGLVMSVTTGTTLLSLPAIDLRLQGTATSAGAYRLSFDASTQIVAAQGQTWTGSFFVQHIAGSITNVKVRAQLVERNASGAWIVASITEIANPSVASRASCTRTLTDVNTARVQFEINISVETVGTYDFTLRIACPQLEQGLYASSPILTYGSAATRAQDVLTGPTANWLNSDSGTLMAEYMYAYQQPNMLPNPTITGAVVGSPGTRPAQWSFAGTAAGLNEQIVALGTTSDGIPYIDVRWYGTATLTTSRGLYFSSTTQIPAIAGQTWVRSVSLALVDGSTNGVTSVNNYYVGRTAAGAFVEFTNQVGALQLTAELQRSSVVTTIANAAVERIQTGVVFSFSNGAVIDMTLRIAAPYLAQYIGIGNQCALSLDNGTSAQAVIQASVANTLDRWLVTSNGSGQLTTGARSYAPGMLRRSVVAIAPNNAAVSTDGDTVQSDSSLSVPSPTQLVIGAAGYFASSRLDGYITRLAYSPLRFENTELPNISKVDASVALFEPTAENIVTQIVGFGVSNGLHFFDVRLVSSSATSGVVNISLDFPANGAGISAVAGQTLTLSCWLGLAGGTLTNLRRVRLMCDEYSGQFERQAIVTTVELTDSPIRYSGQIFVSDNDTLWLQPYLSVLLDGGPVDVTIRIASPQIESGSDVTAWMNPAERYLAGMPSGDTVTHSVTLRAANINGTTDITLPLTVSNGVVITTTTVPTAVINAAYTVAFEAESLGTPVWSVASGTLPPGLELTPAGVLFGIPTTIGFYQFTVRAVLQNGTTATRVITITVANVASPPLITTASLPSAVFGTPYIGHIQVTGTSPFYWSVTQGNLPPGLSLNPSTGAISGTPAATGLFPMVVQVRNDFSSVTKEFAIFVSAVASSSNAIVSPWGKWFK